MSKRNKKDQKTIFLLSLLTLPEFYLHLQTFSVIFSSYRFQMKQISTLEIQCANTSDEIDSFTSWAQLFSKMDLGLEIQKKNVGIKISILEIPYVPTFSQNEQLSIFRPKFAQKWI